MSLQILKSSGGVKRDAVVPTSTSQVFASADEFDTSTDNVASGREGGTFDVPLDDWGVRPGAVEGECKLRGKWISQANGVKTGIWQSTPGSFDVVDRQNVESVHILKGVVRFTDLKTNKVTVVGAGDCATLELGSSVRWDIIETVTKFFVISDGQQMT